MLYCIYFEKVLLDRVTDLVHSFDEGATSLKPTISEKGITFYLFFMVVVVIMKDSYVLYEQW